MKQTSYNTIVACIQHGASATAPQLIGELNEVINDSNQLRQLAQQAANNAKELQQKEAIEDGSTVTEKEDIGE